MGYILDNIDSKEAKLLTNNTSWFTDSKQHACFGENDNADEPDGLYNVVCLGDEEGF